MLNVYWHQKRKKEFTRKNLFQSFMTLLSQKRARKLRSTFALLCKPLTREIALSIDLRCKPTIFRCDVKYVLVVWFWWDKNHSIAFFNLYYICLLCSACPIPRDPPRAEKNTFFMQISLLSVGFLKRNFCLISLQMIDLLVQKLIGPSQQSKVSQ